VLAIFASRLLNGQRPMIFEDGEQRRDFGDRAVLAGADVEHAADRLGQLQRVGKGAGDIADMDEVARELARAMGHQGVEPEIVGKSRIGDIRHCFCDTRLSAGRLGFRATKDFGEGLGELAEWVALQTADDRVAEARAELEARGLVA
jgi:dTDP-L-rhamnose 4-epimerase